MPTSDRQLDVRKPLARFEPFRAQLRVVAAPSEVGPTGDLDALLGEASVSMPRAKRIAVRLHVESGTLPLTIAAAEPSPPVAMAELPASVVDGAVTSPFAASAPRAIGAFLAGHAKPTVGEPVVTVGTDPLAGLNDADRTRYTDLKERFDAIKSRLNLEIVNADGSRTPLTDIAFDAFMQAEALDYRTVGVTQRLDLQPVYDYIRLARNLKRFYAVEDPLMHSEPAWPFPSSLEKIVIDATYADQAAADEAIARVRERYPNVPYVEVAGIESALVVPEPAVIAPPLEPEPAILPPPAATTSHPSIDVFSSTPLDAQAVAAAHAALAVLPPFAELHAFSPEDLARKVALYTQRVDTAGQPEAGDLLTAKALKYIGTEPFNWADRRLTFRHLNENIVIYAPAEKFLTANQNFLPAAKQIILPAGTIDNDLTAVRELYKHHDVRVVRDGDGVIISSFTAPPLISTYFAAAATADASVTPSAAAARSSEAEVSSPVEADQPNWMAEYLAHHQPPASPEAASDVPPAVRALCEQLGIPVDVKHLTENVMTVVKNAIAAGSDERDAMWRERLGLSPDEPLDDNTIGRAVERMLRATFSDLKPEDVLSAHAAVTVVGQVADALKQIPRPAAAARPTGEPAAPRARAETVPVARATEQAEKPAVACTTNELLARTSAYARCHARKDITTPRLADLTRISYLGNDPLNDNDFELLHRMSGLTLIVMSPERILASDRARLEAFFRMHPNVTLTLTRQLTPPEAKLLFHYGVRWTMRASAA